MIGFEACPTFHLQRAPSFDTIFATAQHSYE